MMAFWKVEVGSALMLTRFWGGVSIRFMKHLVEKGHLPVCVESTLQGRRQSH